MNSSTSNSSFDWRTLALIVALLLTVEVGIRVAEPWLSLDIKHIREIPEILSSVHDDDSRSSIVFLGNSLTRRGVDLDLIADTLDVVGTAPVSLGAIYPDDTTILDWLYLHEHEFVRRQRVPDVLVLSFALRHLVDGDPRPTQTYRLGRHFTSWQSLRELFHEDVLTLGDRVNVILSKVSYAFANRERVSRRIFATLPRYELVAQRVHEAATAPSNVSNHELRPTYTALERFIRRAIESGSTVIVVAMPVRSTYELDVEIVRVVEANGASFVDARQVPGLEQNHFIDSLHLGPRGAELYSAYLGQILSGQIYSLDRANVN